MKKEFEFTMPLSNTRQFMGQIKISGYYWMDNAELKVEVNSVYHASVSDACLYDWRYIPPTFWTWLENGSDRIGEIAYEHCKGLLPQPDTTTDLQQEHSHVVQTKGGLS